MNNLDQLTQNIAALTSVLSSSLSTIVSATATPTANKIPIADIGGKLDTWVSKFPSVQQVVTGSRVIGTVYQNTTGRPMFVIVTSNSTNASAVLNALSDASNPPTTSVDYLEPINQQRLSVKFWVLPGNYYKITMTATASLYLWTEWY
jgi:hypothetical protein